MFIFQLRFPPGISIATIENSETTQYFFHILACAVDVKVIAAIDINTTANEVYAYNYPDTTLLNRNIEVGGGKMLHYLVTS
jgi:hypothetical protein